MVENYFFFNESYFIVPKKVRLEYTHCVIMRTSSHRKPQQIAFNNSSDNAFDGLRKFIKNALQIHVSF